MILMMMMMITITIIIIITTTTAVRSRVRLVSIVFDYGLDNDFSSIRCVHNGSGDHSVSCRNGYLGKSAAGA
jgi:hypothetical protein